MINPFRKQELEYTAEQFCAFYRNPVKPKFSGSSNLDNLSKDEQEFVKKIIERTLGIPLNSTNWLIDCFNDPNRLNLALFLIGSSTFAPVLSTNANGNTAFTMLVKHGLVLEDKKEFMRLLQKLYERGYASQTADLKYLKASFDKLKNDYQCLVWGVARFAYKLNDARLIKQALQYHMTLLTIVSFKMRRPFGINYHNLLGVANSALQHYRSNVELLIHAMEIYDVYYDIEKRDHKKTFRQRIEDFYETMPPQDPDIAEIAFLLFPELTETTSVFIA